MALGLGELRKGVLGVDAQGMRLPGHPGTVSRSPTLDLLEAVLVADAAAVHEAGVARGLSCRRRGSSLARGVQLLQASAQLRALGLAVARLLAVEAQSLRGLDLGL